MVEDRPLPELEPVWRAWWQQDLEGAVAAADRRGWSADGNVAGERARQSLRSARGQRPELVAELRAWRSEQPADPDLAYLEARMLQDPDRAQRRFRELLRHHPNHPWLRLGLASLLLGDGASARVVRQHLRLAPLRSDAALFRRQLEARLLVHEDQADRAFDLLEDDAFRRGDRDALFTWVEVADRAQQPVQERRARTEIALRRIRATDPVGLRVAVVAERALAEAAARPELGLDGFLASLDGWCGRVGLETGWQAHPRYSLGPIGELVRPEATSGGPAGQWADAGVLLLVGEAVFHGLELLLLTEVERHVLPWPGEAEPIEVAVAGQGRSSRTNLAAGGTIFHGFYIRLDLLRLGAAGLDQRAAQVLLSPERAELPPALEADPAPRRLPEDLDLPLRLQARLLQGPAQAFELERELLLLHEAGHLPDVLRWLPDGPSFLAALPAVLHSLVASGDPMTWLEYRAALRALAATPHPRWALADLVRTVRGGSPRYRHAYRWLLEDLLELGAARGFPAFHRWDELDPALLREMAVELCRDRGLELLPDEAVAALLRAAAADDQP